MIALAVVAALLTALGGLTRSVGSEHEARSDRSRPELVQTVEAAPVEGFSIKPIEPDAE